MKKCDTCDIKYAMYMYDHTPTLIFYSSLSKKIKTNPNQLLYPFRRSLDCTEHVQQAVKPLGYP